METVENAPTCFAYKIGRENYEARAPEAFPCGSRFGDLWMPQYQTGACCDADATYYTMTGQSSAFIFGYAAPQTEDMAFCVGYTRAMKALWCSPDQGRHVVNGKFRVCREACDMVYAACGPAGTILADNGYTDAESMCRNFWGYKAATASSQEQCPYAGPVCDNKITLEIVDGTPGVDCVSFSRPSFDIGSDPNVPSNYCILDNDWNYDAADPCRDLRDTNYTDGSNSTRRFLNSDDSLNCQIPLYARSQASLQDAQECNSSTLISVFIATLFAAIINF